jgi:cell division protein FtsB
MIFKKNRKRIDLERRYRQHRFLWFSVAAVVTGYFAFLMVFNERGLAKFLDVVRTHRQLTQEIQRLQEKNEDLRQRAQALRSDSDTIEEIARQELGLVKKGELIYQFQKEPQP